MSRLICVLVSLCRKLVSIGRSSRFKNLTRVFHFNFLFTIVSLWATQKTYLRSDQHVQNIK